MAVRVLMSKNMPSNSALIISLKELSLSAEGTGCAGSSEDRKCRRRGEENCSLGPPWVSLRGSKGGEEVMNSVAVSHLVMRVITKS